MNKNLLKCQGKNTREFFPSQHLVHSATLPFGKEVKPVLREPSMEHAKQSVVGAVQPLSLPWLAKAPLAEASVEQQKLAQETNIQVKRRQE